MPTKRKHTPALPEPTEVVDAEVTEEQNGLTYFPTPADDNAPEAARRKGRALSVSDQTLIIVLRDQGLSQEAIARRLNTTQGTISKYLKRFTPSAIIARQRIQAEAVNVAEKLIKNAKTTANADVQFEYLNRADVLVEKSKETGPSVVINTGSVDRLGVLMQKWGEE